MAGRDRLLVGDEVEGPSANKTDDRRSADRHGKHSAAQGHDRSSVLVGLYRERHYNE